MSEYPAAPNAHKARRALNLTSAMLSSNTFNATPFAIILVPKNVEEVAPFVDEGEMPRVILTTATRTNAGGDLKAHTKQNRCALAAWQMVHIPLSTLLKGTRTLKTGEAQQRA
jgi:hypothetical protein